jgi:cytochrome c553
VAALVESLLYLYTRRKMAGRNPRPPHHHMTGNRLMKPRLLATALCLAAAAGAAAAQDPNLARNLAASCANCHGTNGKAVAGSGMATLAGVDKDRLLQHIRDFKSGVKPATIMHQIAKGYSDEQMALIAGYFAAQK